MASPAGSLRRTPVSIRTVGRGWYGYHAAQDPRAILAQRHARGEIDHNEYRERLNHLVE
jgi:uncharacterized membrane protein